MLAKGKGQEAKGKRQWARRALKTFSSGKRQKTKDLAVRVHQLSDGPVLKKDFGLRDHLRRSAISIASNLAEGDERGTDREAVRFFYMAKGSVAELRTQFQIAHEIGYVDRPAYEDVERECVQLGKMIGSLIRARSRPACPAPLA